MDATRAVAQAVGLCRSPPRVLLQGSAIGFYGATAASNDEPFDENASAGRGFLAEVAVAWEQAAAPVEARGTRLVFARTGVVLGKGGGVLERFVTPFKLFVGGPLGSWIHMADQTGAMVHLLENEELRGPFNLTAPMPVTMGVFCRELGRALGRPSWFPTPGFAVKLVMGEEMARELVLEGPRVLPTRLLASGYAFTFPEVGPALQDLCSPRNRGRE